MDPFALRYVRQHGDKSWELDALSPEVIAGLIRGATLQYRDEKQWAKDVKAQEKERNILKSVARNWRIVPDALDTHNYIRDFKPTPAFMGHHVRQVEGD